MLNFVRNFKLALGIIGCVFRHSLNCNVYCTGLHFIFFYRSISFIFNEVFKLKSLCFADVLIITHFHSRFTQDICRWRKPIVSQSAIEQIFAADTLVNFSIGMMYASVHMVITSIKHPKEKLLNYKVIA